MPMVELFRCNELVAKEGEWWYYRPEMWRLEQKVTMPVGSCYLALPLWDDKGINQVYDVSKIRSVTRNPNPRKRKPTPRCSTPPNPTSAVQ
ncbi:UNVERIFIED_CONTAM: UDP-glucuronate:xylan alpha-glucuronosyltransferase 2 [Sesamum latifolium]|uniref:UDP-glucuronate:xylan alpha-glucuronosyltransferase 2 n=1 Tax=Sesamum latifolium TaxID=2727402 RepID=A0AAW2WBN9_9LAMI